MEPTTVAVLVGVFANAVVVVASLSLWLGYRARRAEREERLLEETRRVLGPVEARLADLTRAVEATAIEVERLGEAQRHAVLQSRGDTARPEAIEPPRTAVRRTVTPH